MAASPEQGRWASAYHSLLKHAGLTDRPEVGTSFIPAVCSIQRVSAGRNLPWRGMLCMTKGLC